MTSDFCETNPSLVAHAAVAKDESKTSSATHHEKISFFRRRFQTRELQFVYLASEGTNGQEHNAGRGRTRGLNGVSFA